MIKENLQNLFKIIGKTNSFGETITLVGATKTREVDEINQAISLGLTDIGENKAQEFRDKFDKVLPCNYHFFGRLQKNKVKYLIGKAFLIQSVDSFEIASEISLQSQKANVVSNILLEINLGEEQKGGFPLDETIDAYNQIKSMPNVCIKGLMCVLPNTENESLLKQLCLLMRKKYDIIKKDDDNFCFLSIGMSKDYKTAIECGSNMIRIGTAIFGERNYKEKS